MKSRMIILIIMIAVVIGCSPHPKKNILAKVNNYEITVEEFEEEFMDSPYAKNNTLDSRKEFLQVLINRKLILQYAEARGLDKDKEFLKMIEKFWEQSLLTMVLDKTSKEIAGLVMVSDSTIEEAYQRMLKNGETDKSYDAMYQKIKWDITKLKETKVMNDWVADLHRKSNIVVKENLLLKDN